jgi:hypothetical protein
MTNSAREHDVPTAASRRQFAKAVTAALAVAGFGGAIYSGVLARQDDGVGEVGIERRRCRRRKGSGGSGKRRRCRRRGSGSGSGSGNGSGSGSGSGSGNDD